MVKIKIKLKIFIDDSEKILECADYRDFQNAVRAMKGEIITKILESELDTSRSKSEAVRNTAGILDVDESFIWKTLKKLAV